MGLIREPLDVDFFVDPRPLTDEDRKKISKYIRDYKAKHSKRVPHAKKTTRRIGRRISQV